MQDDVDWEKFALLSDEEQKEIAALLVQIDEAAEVNPLLFFEPHEKQAHFLSAKPRFKWMLGGNQSGKTTVCTIDDLIQAVDEDCLPDHLKAYKKWQPPFKWRVIAPDYDLIEQVVHEAFKKWCPLSQLVGNNWDDAYDKQRRVLRFKNGSRCQFKTYGQDAWTHGGVTLHRVRFDEEPPQDIYNENMPRIMAEEGDVLIAMTPVQGLTWMYDHFWIPWERGDLKDSFVQTVDMDDNFILSDDTKAVTLSGYSLEEREGRKTGRFIHFHGLVYESFSREHIVPECEPPEGSLVYVGIDPGIRHMAAVVYAYHTQDDDLVVFQEFPLTDSPTASDVCKAIHLYNSSLDIKPRWYVIDPAARNKEHITGRSTQMEYADQGVLTFAGQNDVPAGINNVKVRLENHKLFIAANCVETIKEFHKYRWSTPPRQSPNDARESPIKKDDHLLDALRYLVMARPYRPELHFSSEPVHPLVAAIRQEMSGPAKQELPAHFY